MSSSTDSPPALAVLAVEPWERSLTAHQITAMCEGIPGVKALRVDAARGRIHVLYDGTATTIERVESSVQVPGHRIRLIGKSASSPPRT